MMKYIPRACLVLLLFKLSLPLVEAKERTTHPSMEWDLQHTAEKLDPTKYDKRVRPRRHLYWTGIGIRLHPIAINDLDPVSGTMSTTAWMFVWWNDTRLSWTESKTWNLDLVNVPQDEVWHPDLVMRNTATDLKYIGDKKSFIGMRHDGRISWTPYHEFESQCDFDLKFFPFDKHACELQFTAWSFKHTVLKIKTVSLRMLDFQASGQFDLIGIDYEERDIQTRSMAVYTIRVRRKPLFVTMTTIIPIVLMGILNVFVFVLPFDSGEKVSYTITVFLTFVVTLSYVTSILPDQSKSLSYLTIYLGCQIIQSVIETLLTILLCRWYQIDEKETPVPKLLAFLGKKRSCCWCCTRNNDTNPEETVAPEDYYHDLKVTGISSRGMMGREQSRGRKMSYAEYRQKQDASEEDNTDNTVEDMATWKRAMNSLDKIFFVIFGLVNIALSAIYFVGVIYHVSTD